MDGQRLPNAVFLNLIKMMSVGWKLYEEEMRFGSREEEIYGILLGELVYTEFSKLIEPVKLEYNSEVGQNFRC